MCPDSVDRPKTTYDLPLEYKEAVRQLARRLNTSNSQTLQLIIQEGLASLSKRHWKLNEVQRARSATHRFQWDLVLPELPEYDFTEYELDEED